jgi:hypothetical protein
LTDARYGHAEGLVTRTPVFRAKQAGPRQGAGVRSTPCSSCLLILPAAAASPARAVGLAAVGASTDPRPGASDPAPPGQGQLPTASRGAALVTRPSTRGRRGNHSGTPQHPTAPKPSTIPQTLEPQMAIQQAAEPAWRSSGLPPEPDAGRIERAPLRGSHHPHTRGHVTPGAPGLAVSGAAAADSSVRVRLEARLLVGRHRTDTSGRQHGRGHTRGYGQLPRGAGRLRCRAVAIPRQQYVAAKGAPWRRPASL